MKKGVLLIVICFFANITFGQKTVFNIKYSEQLAVFMFLENISDNYSENDFKIAFNKSNYNTDKFKKLISEFGKLSLDYSYTFSEFPYGTKMPGMTNELLKTNLIATNSLNEFKLHSVGIITNKALINLTNILAEFTPIYNEVIYNPNKVNFEKQVLEINNYCNSQNVSEFFETGLRFYNSNWDSNIPFEIAFYPLLNSKGFSAQAFNNNFICGIKPNLKDYKGLLSILFHETFHILYNEQSLQIKSEINSYFKENKSNCKTYAFLLLNEVLATDLGNGYVFEELDGNINKSDWYANKYINLMAKQIYPSVREYILQKKGIDKDFIENYIKTYEQNFPEWINELDNIMTYRYIISENTADFDVIGNAFPYCSASENDAEITEASIDKMKLTPLTKIIIVSKNNNSELKLVKKKFSELKNWKCDSEKEFEYKILLQDKTQLFVINQKKSTIETLIQKLKFNK